MYFFADLHGTLSPPVFLDRLGATLVNRPARPPSDCSGSARSSSFVPDRPRADVSQTISDRVDRVQTLLGWPVIILGVICLVFWLLGAWFRQIRQSIRRLLRASGRGPIRRAHQEPEIPPPRPGRRVPVRTRHRPRADSAPPTTGSELDPTRRRTKTAPHAAQAGSRTASSRSSETSPFLPRLP